MHAVIVEPYPSRREGRQYIFWAKCEACGRKQEATSRQEATRIGGACRTR